MMVQAILILAASASVQPEPPCWREGAELRMAGEFSAAERVLEACLEAQPENADTFVQLGLARLAQGEFDGAGDTLNRALAIAPDYADATIGLARIAYFEGRFDEALSLLDEMPAARTDAQELRVSVVEARAAAAERRPPWRLDLAYSRSALSEDLPAWSQGVIALGREFGKFGTVTGRIARAERFAVQDTLLEARLDKQIAGASVYVAVNGAPDAVFSPEIRVQAGVQGPIGPGYVARADFSLAQYVSGDVATVSPGLYRILGDDAGRLGGRLVILRDEAGEIRYGWALSAEAQASSWARIVTSYTNAPETSEGATLDVSALTLGLRMQLDDRTGLTLLGIHEERPAYDRTGFAVSVSRRF